MINSRNTLKPTFDFIVSVIALAVSLPLFLSIIIMQLFISRNTPFFIQNRIGKKGKTFKVIKFRTMNDKKDSNGILLPDIMRITAVGHLLRKTSLDEIPQLLNVLKGEMSLVGPRPLPTKYLARYNSFQARRHEVKPGITGLAQVKGRNLISWEEKFQYDIFYVDNYSFLLDLKILMLTITKVFKRSGVSPEGSEIMPEFFGEEEK